MADLHLQINSDGSIEMRKTVLWPSKTVEREEVLKAIFSRNSWNVVRLFNVSGSHWKVEVSCQDVQYKINLYIGSIRDEARQDDEFKMQLGNSYPTEDEDGWITLILGIYAISNNNEEIVDYILSAYNSKNFDFSGNPSIRGTRTKGLQMARILGFYKTDKSYLFRPDFIYYYIQNLDTLNNVGNSKHTVTEYNLSDSSYLPYLAALRTKPFMLLAGISGTGKSRIARQIAKACWAADSEERTKQVPSNFCMIQVKPNWHDSTELLGYVSRIEGEKYVTGDFLPFIAKAWDNLDIPHVVCLDEMNLAPVEQYFAEYLSVIESRKVTKGGEITTDPIIKRAVKGKNENGEIVFEDWYVKLIKSLLADCSVENVYALTKQFEDKGITLPPNLFVIGTVNMDETTFSFSRKVLDRAMTIEMNEVDLYGGLTQEEQNELGEIGNNIIGVAVEGKDVYEDHKTYCDQVIEYLKEVNDILEGTPFKIAYRTRNEFLLYAVNRKAFDNESTLETALDEMTSMKILPRIEGDSERVKQPLEALKQLMTHKSWTEESVSLKKINEMLTKLQQSGYTSYWT